MLPGVKSYVRCFLFFWVVLVCCSMSEGRTSKGNAKCILDTNVHGIIHAGHGTVEWSGGFIRKSKCPGVWCNCEPCPSLISKERPHTPPPHTPTPTTPTNHTPNESRVAATKYNFAIILCKWWHEAVESYTGLGTDTSRFKHWKQNFQILWLMGPCTC